MDRNHGKGPFRGLNPGPPAPKAGIIPLDQSDTGTVVFLFLSANFVPNTSHFVSIWDHWVQDCPYFSVHIRPPIDVLIGYSFKFKNWPQYLHSGLNWSGLLQYSLLVSNRQRGWLPRFLLRGGSWSCWIYGFIMLNNFTFLLSSKLGTLVVFPA